MKNELDRHSAQEPKPKSLAYNKTFQTLVAAVGVSIALTVITGCSAFDSNRETPTIPPIPTPAVQAKTVPPAQEILIKTDQQIIMEEVQRSGIHYSASEQELWPIFNDDLSLMSEEQKANEAQKRMITAITAMGKSENPFFRDSARYLEELFQDNNFTIRLVPVPLTIGSEKILTPMGTDIEIMNGKLHRLIVVNIKSLLEYPHLIEIALGLTHELEHTGNSIEFEKSLSPSLSVDQKLFLDLQRSRDQNIVVLEESDGLGRESQAYTYAYGLGFHQETKGQNRKLAAVFIRSGANPESTAWKKFVAQALGIKNWQPKGN